MYRSPPPTSQDPHSASLAESLALRAQKGDRIAFAELVRRFEPRLHSFIVERVRCHAEASDITQSAFLKAWIHIGDYSSKWKFSTWLFVIAHRLAISHLRTRRPVAPAVELEQAPDANFSSHSDRPTSAIWRTARDHLPDEAFTILRLRYVEDLAISEIAQVVDRSEVAVRVSLFRARKRLAELLPSQALVESTPPDVPSGIQTEIQC